MPITGEIENLIRSIESAFTSERHFPAQACAALAERLHRNADDFPRVTVVGSQPRPPGFHLDRIDFDVYELRVGTSGLPKLPHIVYEQAKFNADLQEKWGLDIYSEGEIFRNFMAENDYITYPSPTTSGVLKRDLHITFKEPPHTFITKKFVQNEALRWRGPFLVRDFAYAQALAAKPVKVNLPGPLSYAKRIPRALADAPPTLDLWEFLAREFAQILAQEIRVLVAVGCRWIQIDDPHLTWESLGDAEIGLSILRDVVLPSAAGAKVVVHMCRGNAYDFTNLGERAAEVPYYSRIAPSLSRLGIDCVSIEDPCVSGSLELEKFSGKHIFFGVADVHTAEAESLDKLMAIADRCLREVGERRLTLTPKCGMRHFPPEVATKKMATLKNCADRIFTRT